MTQHHTRPPKRFAPRPCAGCHQAFTPNCARHVRCAPCARQYRLDYYATRHATAKANKGRGGKHEQPKGRVQHIETRSGRFIYRPDFLLALPEMRAALNRTAFDGFDCGRDNDPLIIGYGGRRAND